jgi:hypothetical protein
MVVSWNLQQLFQVGRCAMARTERRLEVDDGAVLAALAHPLRVALLYQLNALGSRTASQCAEALERPWRPVYTGLSLHAPADDADPDVATAARATRASLANLEIQEHARLARQYLRLEPRAPRPWRETAGVNSYSLRLTAEELADLVQTLDAAIRPYIGLTRDDPPEGSQPVHLDFKAFLRPEALT